MSARAQSLADLFERTNNELIQFATSLSGADWMRYCPNEERNIAALVYHVAVGYPFELRVFKAIAAGDPLPNLSRADLDAMNAEDGEAHANEEREETLDLLRRNGAQAAEWVCGLNDDDLRKTGEYIEGIPEMTIEQWIERVLIGHIGMHLASMRAVVDERPSPTAD